MRITTIFFGIVLLAGAASSENVTVVPNPVAASERVRLIVLRNGATAKGMSVTLYRTGQEFWKGKTDLHGVVFLPRLAPGDYRVDAGDRRWAAEMYLAVGRKKARSTFEMTLVRVDGLAGAAGLPVTQRIEDFRGAVVDPTGVPIPKSSIDVYWQRELDAEPLMELSTDENGTFFEHLMSGTYVAVFKSQGFQKRILVFDVVPAGERELLVTLEVGRS